MKYGKQKLHEKGWTIIPILAIPVAMFLHEEFFSARWNKSNWFPSDNGDKSVRKKKGMRAM